MAGVAALELDLVRLVGGAVEHLEPLKVAGHRGLVIVGVPLQGRSRVECARGQCEVVGVARERERFARRALHLVDPVEAPSDPRLVEEQPRARVGVVVRNQLVAAIEHRSQLGLRNVPSDAAHPGGNLDRAGVRARGLGPVARRLGDGRLLASKPQRLVAAEPSHCDVGRRGEALQALARSSGELRPLLVEVLGAHARPAPRDDSGGFGDGRVGVRPPLGRRLQLRRSDTVKGDQLDQLRMMPRVDPGGGALMQERSLGQREASHRRRRRSSRGGRRSGPGPPRAAPGAMPCAPADRAPR